MRFFNRSMKHESRRHLLRLLRIYHAKVHPKGIRIMPEAQGSWMRNRDDIKCCRFCGHWYILHQQPRKNGYGHWLKSHE